MAFDARLLAAEQADKLRSFEFIGLDGETYFLPSLKELPTRRVRQFESDQSVDALLELVAELSPEAAAAVDEMPVGVAADLLSAWGRTAGTAGKSPSASSQRKPAGKPPKRT